MQFSTLLYLMFGLHIRMFDIFGMLFFFIVMFLAQVILSDPRGFSKA